jgi:hypothetical protein
LSLEAPQQQDKPPANIATLVPQLGSTAVRPGCTTRRADRLWCAVNARFKLPGPSPVPFAARDRAARRLGSRSSRFR